MSPFGSLLSEKRLTPALTAFANRSGSMSFCAESIVAEYAGVRVDVPLESHPLAKQLAEKRGIIGPGHFFELLLFGLPPFRGKLPAALCVRWIVVVGHDRAGSRVHRGLEWRKLVFEEAVRSGVDGPLPPRVV